MHAARRARMMSNTALPLMIDSSKCMVPAPLIEPGRPHGIEHRVEVGRPGIGAQEQGSGVLGRGYRRPIPLDRRERRTAGAAHEQSMGGQEFLTRLNGLALGYQDDVVNLGMRQQLRDDARSDAWNMAFAGCSAEYDGSFGIDGDDPNVGIVLLESTRYSGDRSGRADAEEDIIKRVEIGADLSRRQLVVRRHGVRVSVLVRPVGVRNRGT